MLTVYIVRHGLTTNSQEGVVTGHSDARLTASGIDAVIRLSQRLKDTKFEAIYSSDLQRSLSTAQIIVKTLGLTVSVNQCKELREINYGIYTNRRKADVAKECQEYKKEVDFVFPGGESFSQLQQRVVGFMKEIERRHDDHTILLVTHAGAIRAISCDAHNGNLVDYLQVKISHTYLARLDKDQGALVSYDVLVQ